MPQVDAQPYAFTFAPRSVALLIIDMQRDFLEPGGFGETLATSRLRTAIVPTARRRRHGRAHREGHRPDLWTLRRPSKRDRPRPDRDPGPMGRILVRGEPGRDIIPELAPALGSRWWTSPARVHSATDHEAMLPSRGVAVARAASPLRLCQHHGPWGKRPRLRLPVLEDCTLVSNSTPPGSP
jgi:hypothetical protein